MENIKPWFLSKTMWGALIAVLASLLQIAGLDLDGALHEDLADSLVSLAGAVGGLLAIYGRLTAQSRLG